MKLIKVIIAVCAMLAVLNCKAIDVDSTFYLNGQMGKLNVHLQLPDKIGLEKIPVVIICHGLTGNQNEPFISKIAADALKEGLGVVRFDFNGHGKSDGDFQYMDAQNIQDDLKRVIAWTAEQPFTKYISLLGHSLGGIVAGMVAPELGAAKIKSVVLIASGGVAPDLMLIGNFFGIMFDPWNLPEYLTLPDGKKLGRNYLQTMRDLPIYQTAAKYTGPALVLNGRKDTIVPYNYAIRYAEVMPGAELHIIENENHGFTVTANETAAMIARWLKEQDSK